MDEHADDGPPQLRFQFDLRTLLSLVTWSVLFGVAVSSFSQAHWGAVLVFIFLPAVGSLLWILFRIVRDPGYQLILNFIAVLVVYAIFFGSLEVTRAVRLANPPPRPMFHDAFRADHVHRPPVWHPVKAERDSRGNRLWLDTHDNVLVLLLADDTTSGWYDEADFGVQQTEFFQRTPNGTRSFTLPRTKNELIVVLPDGKPRRFPLAAGVTGNRPSGLHWYFLTDQLIASVRANLSADQQPNFDALIQQRYPLDQLPTPKNQDSGNVPASKIGEASGL